MTMLDLDNWKTQIKKGYLELCLLNLIDSHQRVYGFQILELLESLNMPLKEGTLYPLLNRMTVDGTLSAVWETENLKGHPRKFYSLTARGKKILEEMKTEFKRMVEVYDAIPKLKPEGK
jgi:PadR family transcriptional regulator, regulatory protein PadR